MEGKEETKHIPWYAILSLLLFILSVGCMVATYLLLKAIEYQFTK